MTDTTHSHAKGTSTRTANTTLPNIDTRLAAVEAGVKVLESVSLGPSGFGMQIEDLEARVAALEKSAPPPDPVPVPPDPPPVTPSPTQVTVRSISDLYAALAADRDDILWAPGVYPGNLIIDDKYAARTKPGVIRCAGVTLKGTGALNTGCIGHHGGAHNLEWLDLTIADTTLTQTGVLMFGGWDEPAAHHITLRRFKVLSSVKRSDENHTTEHGVYFSIAQGGIHDVLIEDLSVDATDPMGLATAIHADHGDPTQTAHNIVVRNVGFKGNGSQGSSIQYPIILWTPSYRNWLFDGGTITNANGSAIRVQSTTSTNIVFRNITSTGSRYGGLYGGTVPAGVTVEPSCSLK